MGGRILIQEIICLKKTVKWNEKDRMNFSGI